jgi:hypothetical protein
MLSPQSELNENRLKQVHEYIRHIAQLLIAWFTFFVTVNYAVMGWLLVSLFALRPLTDSHRHSGLVLPLITGLFALQIYDLWWVLLFGPLLPAFIEWRIAPRRQSNT